MQDNDLPTDVPTTAPQDQRRWLIKGVNPQGLSLFFFGESLAKARWLRQLLAGGALYVLTYFITPHVSPYLTAIMTLASGFIILHGACQALIKSTLWIAASWQLSRYAAGTLVELAGTIPELVVVALLAVHSPMVALVTALVTIYNNTLLFSLYSFFLPKNQQKKFIMPTPITEAGTQALVAGSVIAVSCGFALLAFSAVSPTKTTLSSGDLLTVALALLIVFGFYLAKLLHDSESEEQETESHLQLDESEKQARKAAVYQAVTIPHFITILTVSMVGIGSAFAGGYFISAVAETALHQLHFNILLTGIILAFAAGMSEVILLLSAHRQGQYGIALANAFGGIAQVLLFVLPFTLLIIAGYLFWGTDHGTLPIDRILVFLVLFLFPLFHVFAGLLEEDHSFDLLDTCIMTVMIFFLFILLINYGT